MDENLYKQFTQGFLSSVYSSLNPIELEHLAFSARLLTLECGIRFLTDFLDGDVYFKTQRENHNLDRARTQLKLVHDMEQKTTFMKKVVCDYIGRF